jgi:uncharacterized membrane protein YdjX (TVP38/TMEM64 family)
MERGAETPGGSQAGIAMPRRRRLFAVLAILAFAAAAISLNRYVTPAMVLSRYDVFRAFVDGHFASALLIYMACYVTAVSLSVPGSVLLTVLGGLLFGWVWGGLAATVSASLGAIVVFSIARSAFGALIVGRAAGLVERLAAGLKDNAVSYLLFLRFVPIFPFWLVNLACALMGVRLSLFATTTFLGITPGTLAFSAAGSGLDSVVMAQKAAYEACIASGSAHCYFQFSLRTLATPGLMGALAALGCVALLPILLRRLGLLPANAPNGS